MEELGNKLGKTKSAISRWESGENSPKVEDIEKIKDLFDVDIETLIFGSEGNSSIETIYNQLDELRQAKVYTFAEEQLKEQKNSKIVPLVGSTAANPTELAYGDTIYDETVETNVPHTADCALVIQGDSMEPDFMDGSIVFYKLQKNVESGELAIIEIEGNGVTFKKVCFDYDNKQVILKSLNEKYENRVVSPDQIRVVGKVIQ